ncbi:MAG TPA: LPS assembly protein LptD [Rickettsiales bacterium]|nr:LPS assembly protein LptD [Rickettsiales bacterium]
MHFLLRIFIISLLSSTNAFAFNKNSEKPSILKADKIDGDRNTNIVIATGNVELSNDISVAKSEKMTYDKNKGWLRAEGNLRIKDLEIGEVFATEGEIKDDFSQGFFLNSTIIFNDGSYLKSKKIERKSPLVTILSKPIYSICPNRKITDDNKLAGELFDPISIKSSSTKVDRDKNIMRSTNGIIRFYNIPVFYTPFLQIPLRENKRKSGFLTPSYIKNTQFGIGANIPYFIAAAPNIDWIITPQLYKDSSQFRLTNKVHHIMKYGEHDTELEIANNKLKETSDNNVVKKSEKEYRWHLKESGRSVLTHNSELKHSIDLVGDRNYLREYNFNAIAYTISEINYDYTNKKQYFGAKTVYIQELEFVDSKKASPIILPIFNHYIESKPLFFKEKYALSSNLTAIHRESGLQYRRASFTPELKIPFNLNGNLIDLNTKIETDFYSLENNFRNDEQYSQIDTTQFNYKPEFSAMWRLPLIQKLQHNTLMFEPMVNFVSATFKRDYAKTVNEDSNNSELTVNNLFVTDRIAGFDRNEAGERISYGAKSSMFNKFGNFGLTLGQSYRISKPPQDIAIRGFNKNNKSNIVGEISYLAPQYFSAIYLFQLNESDYNNEVNSLITTLNFKKFFLANDYLLIRKGVINSQELEQDSISMGLHLTPRLLIKGSVSKNLVTRKNNTRSASLEYVGCCVTFKFITTENNTTNLNGKTQRSHSINISIKNL